MLGQSPSLHETVRCGLIAGFKSRGGGRMGGGTEGPFTSTSNKNLLETKEETEKPNLPKPTKQTSDCKTER